MEDQKNIIEDIVNDFLDKTLGLRFDICRCYRCKNKMLKIVVDKFPPCMVDPHQSNYRETFIRITNEYLKAIIEEIMEAVDYVSKNPPHRMEEDREEGFKRLLERIYQDRGLDFSQYHQKLLKRRVALRLRVNKLESYTEYLRFLTGNPNEYEKLFEVLTINVSEFFRDLSVWVNIRKLLKELLVDNFKKKESLKIWSAGCANGEETYSLAILVKEVKSKIPVVIYGTDVDKESILIAQKGLYNLSSLKNVSRELLEKYFERIDGKYALKQEIKNMVILKHHDLINDIFPPDIDLIVCRNVFIYFTKSLREYIFSKFYNSLKDDGYLVIGRAETILSEAKLIFEDIDIESRIYRKVKIKTI